MGLFMKRNRNQFLSVALLISFDNVKDLFSCTTEAIAARDSVYPLDFPSGIGKTHGAKHGVSAVVRVSSVVCLPRSVWCRLSVVWYYLTFTEKKSSTSTIVATYTAVDDDDDDNDDGA